MTDPRRPWKFQRDAARKPKPKPPAPATGACGGPLHIELVAKLAQQGAGTRNFPAAMRAIGVRTTNQPDAWFTREDRKHIDIYEVVVCNGIDPNRRVAYRDFARRLAGAGWTMTIHRVNRRGEVSVYDLFKYPLRARDVEHIEFVREKNDRPNLTNQSPR